MNSNNPTQDAILISRRPYEDDSIRVISSLFKSNECSEIVPADDAVSTIVINCLSRCYLEESWDYAAVYRTTYSSGDDLRKAVRAAWNINYHFARVYRFDNQVWSKAVPMVLTMISDIGDIYNVLGRMSSKHKLDVSIVSSFVNPHLISCIGKIYHDLSTQIECDEGMLFEDISAYLESVSVKHSGTCL